jgi:hypothetical protein
MIKWQIIDQRKKRNDMREDHNKKTLRPAHILTMLALTAALSAGCAKQTVSTESADASANAKPPVMQSETDRMSPDASADAAMPEKPEDGNTPDEMPDDLPDKTPDETMQQPDGEKPDDIPTDTPSYMQENVIDTGAQIPLETAETISAILDDVNSVVGCSVYGIFGVDETNLDAALTQMEESTVNDGVLLLINTDEQTARICGLNRMENFLGAKAYEKIGDAIEDQLKNGTLEDAVQAFADGISSEAIQKESEED